MSSPQKITITLTDAVTGDDVEHELPTKFEVCDRCRGTGSHVNPNVDGNGITAEQFAEDPDFREAYLRGDYDVQCECCKGLRVVAVVDESRCKPALLKAYRKQQREEEAFQRECYMERRREAYAMGERD